MATQPLQIISAGYSQNCKTNVLTPPTGQQINFYSGRVLNQSGGAVDAGICKKLALTAWKLYTYVAVGTVATDYTAAIQSGGAVNIFDTTNNDGFLAGANVPFNVLGLTVSQAQTGSPVYTYKYFNGTAWTALTTQAVPSTYAAADQLVVFPAPQDWAPGTPAGPTVNQSLYYIQVVATTASGVNVQATSAWVCEFLEFLSQLANNTSLDFRVFDSVLPIVLSGTEGLLPYFGGSANAKNMMRIVYSIQG